MNHSFWSGWKLVITMAGLVAAVAVAMAAVLCRWGGDRPQERTAPLAGHTAGSLRSGAVPGLPAGGRPLGNGLVSRTDTINGTPILDPVMVARIERVAAGLPVQLLSNHRPAAQVRYIASAVGPDDDAAIFHGVFREPAAALAFGCALDDHLALLCPRVEPATVGHDARQDFPGLRCTPMRLALGAPVYEPDRCTPDG